ncbi:MAG: sporulation protein YqfD [Lachnospiraceae bacterium]
MIFKILQYIRGYLLIRVTGYSAERFLNACRYRGIRLWNMRPCGNAYEMNISIRGFRKIKPIVRKTGVRVVIVQRSGLPFFLYRYRRRKLFFAGAALFFILIYTLSRFIWSIDFRGNLTRTDETLLEFLKEREVASGMRISDVDCGRIVKDIRKEYDDIIWVSASVEGTKLIIQIKENQDVIKEAEPENEEEADKTIQPEDIVADRDCVVKSIITRKGVPRIAEGTEIKTGDILVSGQVPVNNDAGETIGYQPQVSDADILGQTTVSYEDRESITYEEKKEIINECRSEAPVEKREYYVRIGDWRICFGEIKNKYEHFEQYSSEKRLKLFDNFYLPISFGEKRAVPYTVLEKKREKKELQRILSGRFSQYCEDLEKKGVEIIGNDVKIYTGFQNAEAKGTLTVIMPVGTKRPSQPIEITAPADENEQSGE